MTPGEKLTMKILEAQDRKLKMLEDKSSQQALNIKVQAVILIFFVAIVLLNILLEQLGIH